jgi:chromate reductase
MTETIHVLAISGSLRAKSTNTGLLRAAVKQLPEGMTLEIYPLSEIPLFNSDLYSEGEPASVLEFKRHIADADGLLIATPEYNRSISGVLKNAIDWASRPHRQSPLNRKPLGIIGAAGRMGSIHAQDHLRQIAAGLDMRVMEQPRLTVPRAWEKFDADGNLVDEETKIQLKEYLADLAQWIRSQQER